jgi:hypothetical protein
MPPSHERRPSSVQHTLFPYFSAISPHFRTTFCNFLHFLQFFSADFECSDGGPSPVNMGNFVGIEAYSRQLNTLFLSYQAVTLISSPAQTPNTP